MEDRSRSTKKTRRDFCHHENHRMEDPPPAAWTDFGAACSVDRMIAKIRRTVFVSCAAFVWACTLLSLKMTV